MWVGQAPYGRRRKGRYLASMGLLIGHILSTGLIFITWYTVVWLVSLGVDWLNKVHAMHDSIYQVMILIEKWLVYLDILSCVIFFGVGLWRLCRDMVAE